MIIEKVTTVTLDPVKEFQTVKEFEEQEGWLKIECGTASVQFRYAEPPQILDVVIPAAEQHECAGCEYYDAEDDICRAFPQCTGTDCDQRLPCEE